MDPENWSQLEVILGTHLLAAICGPFDDGQEPQRLEVLSDLVTRLRRRYDNAGVRQWFTETRDGGKPPVDVLHAAWSPADPSVADLLVAAGPRR